jgi:UDP-glucose 4-epimerase
MQAGGTGESRRRNVRGDATTGRADSVARAGSDDSAVPRVVLVTGVARYLGASVAARLAEDSRIKLIIGIDGSAPSAEIAALLPSRVQVVRADIRTPEPAKILIGEHVAAVVHLAVASAADPQTGGRAAMKEHNVIGTLQLLAACQQAPDLKKLVVRSSTAAYGASFRDPAVFTESTEPRAVPRGGYARDVLDIEGYVRGFRRRRRDVAATVLRFAPFIGEKADTTLTRYFSQAIVPTVFGRDPRLQFIHADDALEVLYRAVTGDHPGTFNVAGAGTITLSQAVRRAGRLAFPVPEQGMSALAGFARGLAPREFSLDQLDLFVHGRVVDTSHLVDEFGFEPRSTPVAFADFLRGHATDGPLPADAIRAAESMLLAQIRQVRAGVTAGIAAGVAARVTAGVAAGVRAAEQISGRVPGMSEKAGGGDDVDE